MTKHLWVSRTTYTVRGRTKTKILRFSRPHKNAIDYLYNEWKYKPVAFVSYGGVSGGLRSTQMLKQVVTTIDMIPF